MHITDNSRLKTSLEQYVGETIVREYIYIKKVSSHKRWNTYQCWYHIRSCAVCPMVLLKQDECSHEGQLPNSKVSVYLSMMEDDPSLNI
jgi:hypothetical protein